jgi:hypothetical protein
MYCANEDCRQLLVTVAQRSVAPGIAALSVQDELWIAWPRFGEGKRHIAPEVGDPLRADYEQAAAILEISPRMSAVMSRRILADLLERCAGLSGFSLAKRIDGFTNDKSHPSGLRDNLHHFREIADFGAHTQTDDQAQIIDVGRDEAEWTLDLLDRLFDYFIVAPERDRKMREAMDKRIKDAGRKEINPEKGAS